MDWKCEGAQETVTPAVRVLIPCTPVRNVLRRHSQSADAEDGFDDGLSKSAVEMTIDGRRVTRMQLQLTHWMPHGPALFFAVHYDCNNWEKMQGQQRRHAL